MLTVGSLFSGIGGLDLGLERSGMRVIWQSEIDPYACRVLAKHWPEVPNVGDIKLVDWADVARPDVLCGGYPCQPFSLAGARKGEEDPRHLWPWVRHALRVLRPRYAIFENVRGHLSLGGPTVIGEIAALGYDTEWRVVSAASVGANHRRDRVIIVAHTDNARSGASQCHSEPQRSQNVQRWHEFSQSRASRCSPCMANANGEQLGIDGAPSDLGCSNNGRVYHRTRQTGYDGWEWWETEPGVGRVANGIPHRVDRLRGLGNAVVPQVAEVIGRLVMAHANENQSN
jgi:DNA (cytosine-5)-methyltransferase 1